MINIDNSYLFLWGHQVTWYAFLPVVAAVVIVIAGCIFAYRKKMDVNWSFWMSTCVFVPASLGVLFFNRLPDALYPFLFGGLGVVIMIIYYASAAVFHKDRNFALMQSVLSYFIYGIFSKLGCFLTGCCYGKSYSGFLSVVYGANTLNPLKGKDLFPIQLVQVVCYVIILIVSIVIFMRAVDKAITIGMMTLYTMTYYMFVIFEDKSANQMIIGGIDMSVIMTLVCGLITAWEFTLAWKRQRRVPAE